MIILGWVIASVSAMGSMSLLSAVVRLRRIRRQLSSDDPLWGRSDYLIDRVTIPMIIVSASFRCSFIFFDTTSEVDLLATGLVLPFCGLAWVIYVCWIRPAHQTLEMYDGRINPV